MYALTWADFFFFYLYTDLPCSQFLYLAKLMVLAVTSYLLRVK